MKEIIVRIKYDETRMQVDSSFVLDALMEYTKDDGIIDVKEVEYKIPTDEEIQNLTLLDAYNREVMCYEGHEIIMKNGIEYGLSLVFGDKNESK
jgi:hypothetical protein